MSLIENFKDRVPTKVLPNGAIRYEEFDADGNSLGYKWMRRADEPSEIGDAWNKVTYDGLKNAIESNNRLVGTYTGDGQSERIINLGFTPSAVIVFKARLRTSNNLLYGGDLGFATLNNPAIYNNNRNILEIINNGFKVFESDDSGNYHYQDTNANDQVYNYIAFK